MERLGLNKLGFTKGGQKLYTQVADLALRVDASDSSSYTTSGSNITGWIDLSGNGNDMSPSTSPQLEANVFGSLSAFDFNDNSCMQAELSSFKDFTGMTVITVFEALDTTFISGSNFDDFGGWINVGDFQSASLNVGWATSAFGEEAMSIQNYDSSAINVQTGISGRRMRWEAGDQLVVAFKTGSGETALYRGTEKIELGHYVFDYDTLGGASKDTDFSPDALGITSDWFTVGGFVSGGSVVAREMPAKVGEYLVYGRELSDAEIASIVRQLETKWGISSLVDRDVMIWAGQSNAVGQEGTLVAYNSAQAGSEIFTAGNFRQDLITPTADGATTSDVGPETPASRRHKLTNSVDNVVLKTAFGGTSLAVHWKPTPTFGANLQTALDEWDVALLDGNIKGNGYKPNMLGFFWVQGEQDAQNSSQAAAYETNLTALVNLIRDRYGYMPFIIAKLNDSLGGAFTEKATVRAAQEAVALAMDDVYIVDTDAMTPIGGGSGDGVHYSINQLEELGEKMLDAAVNRANQTCAAVTT